MKTRLLAIVGLLAVIGGCTDADVASKNLSKAADNFEIPRRIVFYDGINAQYMLSVEGLCALGNDDDPGEVTVTCKTGADEYKKHFLGLSDNVTYFAEQLDGANVSAYHYRVVFKPQTLLPDFDFRGDAEDLTKNRN